MIFGDGDNAKFPDTQNTEALSGQLGAKQIVVWGCLIGISVGAITLMAQNVLGVTTIDHGDCTLSDRWGTDASGRILGFLSDEQSAALLVATQKKLRATINPAYLANKRAVVLLSATDRVRHITALVPTSMAVHVGDQVDVAFGYRDRSLPCSYVPNLISHTAAMPKPE